MNLDFKNDKHLIDAEIINFCIRERNRALFNQNDFSQQNTDFFTYLLKNTGGYYYNFENLQEQLNTFTDAVDIEDEDDKFDIDEIDENGRFYFAVELFFEGDDQWVPLEFSDKDEIYDSGEDWSTLFHFSVENEHSKETLDIAKKRNSLIFSFDDLLKNKKNFNSLIKPLSSFDKKTYDAYEFFMPNHFSSKYYICYDPFLLSDRSHILGCYQNGNPIIDYKISQNFKDFTYIDKNLKNDSVLLDFVDGNINLSKSSDNLSKISLKKDKRIKGHAPEGIKLINEINQYNCSNDNIKKIKYEIIDNQTFYEVRNHICLYLDWIYNCCKENNQGELPDVFFGGKINHRKISNIIKDIEKTFLNRVMNSIDNEEELKILKKFISEEKIHFFWFDMTKLKDSFFKKFKTKYPNMSKKDILAKVNDKNAIYRSQLHSCSILTDYSLSMWDMRKDLFEKDLYKKNEFIHKTIDNRTKHNFNVLNLFSTFISKNETQKKGVKYHFEKTEFFKMSNFFRDKINKDLKN